MWLGWVGVGWVEVGGLGLTFDILSIAEMSVLVPFFLLWLNSRKWKKKILFLMGCFWWVVLIAVGRSFCASEKIAAITIRQVVQQLLLQGNSLSILPQVFYKQKDT